LTLLPKDRIDPSLFVRTGSCERNHRLQILMIVKRNEFDGRGNTVNRKMVLPLIKPSGINLIPFTVCL
jgi:hypothetical protein